jgi:hypothetical protein
MCIPKLLVIPYLNQSCLHAPPSVLQWRVFTNMGRELVQQGRHAEAEAYLRRAVEAARQGFGEDDPHMASACNNLAEFYRLRRRYEEAEPLYKQVGEAGLASWKIVSTCCLLSAMWSVSAICQPRHVQCPALLAPHRLTAHLPASPPTLRLPTPRPATCQQALEILTRAYGLHDARVAFSLHNLGGFHLARRQLAQAGECYEQALRMKLEVLGTGHRWVGRYSWGRWGPDDTAALGFSSGCLPHAVCLADPLPGSQQLASLTFPLCCLFHCPCLQRDFQHNVPPGRGAYVLPDCRFSRTPPFLTPCPTPSFPAVRPPTRCTTWRRCGGSRGSARRRPSWWSSRWKS